MTVLCVQCRVPFPTPRHGPAKYCSQACRQAGHRDRNDKDRAVPPTGQDWSWREHAACLGADTELFFPNVGETGVSRRTKGREICGDCPVQAECLDYAVANNIKYGIWGNADNQERVRIRRRRGVA